MPAHTLPAPFRHLWFLAVTVSLLVAVSATAAVWFFLPPPQSLAYAKLHIPVKPADVILQHPEGQMDFQNLLKAQVALIKSRALLEQALARTGIADRFQGQEMDAEWLAQHFKVSFPDSQEIMRVSLERPNAEEARLLVAAVVDAYMEEVVNREMNRLKQQQKHLDAIDETTRKKLDDLAAKHEDLVATYEEKRKELKQLEDRLAKLVVQQIMQRANKPKDLEAILALAQIRKSVNELSEIDAALRGLNLDLDRERRAHELVAHRAKIVGEEIEKADPPRVQLLQPATIVHVIDFPRRLRLSLLAGLGAFAATMLGFALLRRLPDRNGNDPDAGYFPA
jgi:hypothetical protein